MALGRGLRLRVIAEGVETEAQHRALRGLGCELGQGRFYCAPMTSDELCQFLAPSSGRLTSA